MLTFFELLTSPLYGLLLGIVGLNFVLDKMPQWADSQGWVNTEGDLYNFTALISPLATWVVWPFLHEHGSIFYAVLWIICSLVYTVLTFLLGYLLGGSVRRGLAKMIKKEARQP